MSRQSHVTAGTAKCRSIDRIEPERLHALGPDDLSGVGTHERRLAAQFTLTDDS
jgi:hypothetical protein